MSRRWQLLAGGAVLSLVTLGALLFAVIPGSGGRADAAPQTVTVNVGNNWFCEAANQGSSLTTFCKTTINVDDTVQWVRQAGTHNVAECGATWSKWSDPDGLCVGANWATTTNLNGTNTTYSRTFTSPGTFYYLCELHGIEMKGEINVVAAATPTNTPVPPTATSVPPTATSVPPTATGVPPTATGVPPTATGVPPTATDVPPTATGVPPTATGVPPTGTPVPPDATPTGTPVPPDATPTGTPVPSDGTPTDTPVPPDATPTDTPVPPDATPTPTSTVQPVLIGNVDCDGQVTAVDAALILQFSADLISSLTCSGNGYVNEDNAIDAIDAQLVLQYVAGLITGLPVG